MDCLYRGPSPDGRGYVIACGRRRRVKCATCKLADAGLECDGCDRPLCASCSVSPRKELDYCPRCFEPAWKHWLRLFPTSASVYTREERRAAFRQWARHEADTFLRLVPMSATTAGARPTPHALWKQSGGDPEKYRALLIEHGHLVARKEP